jgi:hypothetical protein
VSDDDDDSVVRTRSGRVRKPAVKYGMVDYDDVGALLAQIALAESDAEPLTINEAMNGSDGPQWTEAIKDEHGTWRPATLPPGRKAIGTRFVFKKKLAADGTVARYKGRLVAKGYAQREGVDYNATFAPVLGYPSLRVIMAIVAALDLEFEQMDV